MTEMQVIDLENMPDFQSKVEIFYKIANMLSRNDDNKFALLDLTTAFIVYMMLNNTTPESTLEMRSRIIDAIAIEAKQLLENEMNEAETRH